jgi:hypothetical protein
VQTTIRTHFHESQGSSPEEAKRDWEYAVMSANDWIELTLGTISDADRSSLMEWRVYIKALKGVDTAIAPEINWPEKPEMQNFLNYSNIKLMYI